MEQKISKSSGFHRFLYKVLYPAGLCSTVMTFIMAAIAELSSVDADFKPAVTFKSVVVIILFSFLFALANRILYIKSMSVGGRFALHLLCVSTDFVAVFIFLGGYYTSGTSAAAVSAIFIVLYLIIAAIYFAVRFAVKRSKSNNSAYKKQF